MKIMFFSIICLIDLFDVQKVYFCICIAFENVKNPPSKVGYFTKIVEIFSTTLTEKWVKKGLSNTKFGTW